MQRREKMYSWWPWKRKVSLRKEEVTAGVQSKRGRQFNLVQFKTRATCPITTLYMPAVPNPNPGAT